MKSFNFEGLSSNGTPEIAKQYFDTMYGMLDSMVEIEHPRRLDIYFDDKTQTLFVMVNNIHVVTVRHPGVFNNHTIIEKTGLTAGGG